MEKKKDQDISNGKMVRLIRENLKTTTFMEKGIIFGQMEEPLMGTGNLIKCTDGVFLHGMTVEDTKENIGMIKNKGKELLYGLMAENMMGHGMTGNNMDMELTHQLRVKLNLESGKKGKN